MRMYAVVLSLITSDVRPNSPGRMKYVGERQEDPPSDHGSGRLATFLFAFLAFRVEEASVSGAEMPHLLKWCSEDVLMDRASTSS